MLNKMIKIACIAMLNIAASSATAAVPSSLDIGNNIIIEKPFLPEDSSDHTYRFDL